MLQKLVEPELAKLKVVRDEAAADSAGYLEGYASVFGNRDLGGDVVQKGAFNKTLRERLKRGMIKLFDSHMVYDGTEAVIGVVKEAEEDDYGLKFRAMFSSVPRAQSVRTKIQEGVLDALSFGYEVIKAEPLDDNTRALKELRLFEVSVVAWGMNPKAAITTVKSAFLQPSKFQLLSATRDWDEAKATERLRTAINPAPFDEWSETDLLAYKQCFLWSAPENPADYRLPLVDVIDGTPYYVLVAGKSALEQLRSDAGSHPWGNDTVAVALEQQLQPVLEKFGEKIAPRKGASELEQERLLVQLTQSMKAATAEAYLNSMLKGLGRR